MSAEKRAAKPRHRGRNGRRSLLDELYEQYRPEMLYRRLTSPRRVLPSFLVIGAMRSGTTTLFQQICSHPEVTPPLKKEPHYFTSRYHYPKSWYRAQFPFSGISGEASATMLFRPHVADRVLGELGRLPLVAILRDPVQRAFSQYRMMRNHGRKTPAFSKLLEVQDSLNNRPNRILPVGRYERQFPRWLELFGEQVLVLLHEDYVADPQSVMDRVYAHISLAPHGIDPSTWPNPSPRNLSSDEEHEVRAGLAAYYSPTRAYVSELLGRRLPWEGA